jgi:hypothetical protein
METGKHCPGNFDEGALRGRNGAKYEEIGKHKEKEGLLGFVLINQFQHFLKEKPLSSTISRQRSRT